jgi:hypothetical protein
MTETAESSFTILPSWIKGGANATLFLNNMPKPRHGKLFTDYRDTGFFDLVLPLMQPTVYSCCIFPQIFRITGQLFWGHTKFC